MIRFHRNLFVSIFIILCSLPFHWSFGHNDTSTVQPFNGDDHHEIGSSTSSSSINLSNSVHNQSNILTTSTPTSSFTFTSTDNSGPKSIEVKSSPIANVTSFELSLPTTTTTSVNLTVISQSPSGSTINSTIISSQSLSTSSDQSQSIKSQPQSIPISFDVAIYALGLLLTALLLVSGVYGCVKVYHSRYPARITFGRKFSTFENPIYAQKESSSTGELDGSRENPATEIEDGPVKTESKLVQLI